MDELIQKSLDQLKNNLFSQRKHYEDTYLKNIDQIKKSLLESFSNVQYSKFSILDFNAVSKEGITEKESLPEMIRIGSMYPTNAPKEYIPMLEQPLLYPFSQANATVFMLSDNDAKSIHNLFAQIAFRLLLSLPKELCELRFIDNNYGRDFNIINRLNKSLIGNNILTSSNDISNLIDSLENTLVHNYQQYIISVDTLSEYNASAGDMKEPYRFVFISNFPAGMSPETATKLQNMISNGNAARAGIFFFISVDKRAKLPYGFDLDEFLKQTTIIKQNSSTDYEITHPAFSKSFNEHFEIQLDKELTSDIEDIISTINSKKEKKNTLSFSIAYSKKLEENKFWTKSSQDEIKIPIGYITPKDIQYLQFGKITNDYFGLIGGLPGTGKTTLLHNIILWGAIDYSPEELNYYLIDCKNGTGFNFYKRLPHVKVLSISNDREFGASALTTIIDEMYKRADLFKQASDTTGKMIDNIQTYRKATRQPMPRILAIIDEFQVLFEKEDKLARIMRDSLNKIFTEGRAFGISLLLCSQGLGRVDVPIKNITWRMSFRLLSDMESQRILGNDGALKLTKIGNAIINNQNGEKSSNVNFQVGMVMDNMLSKVEDLRRKYDQLFKGKPLVQFISDGNNNGKIETNTKLCDCLNSDRFAINDRYCDVYIGSPAFIREEHAFVRFRRQQASNLIIVGNDVKSALTIIGMTNFQLAKQSTPEQSKFYIVDCFNVDHPYSEKIKLIEKFSPSVKVVPNRNIADVVDNVSEELESRIKADNNGNNIGGRVVLSIMYMQNSRILKKEGYNTSPVTKKLMRIIKEGPELGIHVILYSLSYPGMMEIIDSNTLNEFENRIALDGGKSLSILTEISNSKISEQGSALLQGPEEFMTYNPDLIRVYSQWNTKNESKNSNVEFVTELLNL